MTDGASLAPTGYSRSGGTHAARSHAARRARPGLGLRLDARDLAVSVAVCVVVATSVPLALLQIPNGAAWLPAGQPDPVGLLRACGVALPAIMMAAPCGAAAVRRAGNGWPVLLAGLLTIALADMAGPAVRTVPLLAADRVLHGIGAGLILPGAAALAVGRHRATATAPTGSTAAPSGSAPSGSARAATAPTVTAAVCAVVTVVSLAAAPALTRDQVLAGATRAGGAWHAMLEPYPWLPVVALIALSAYLPLAGGETLRRRDAAGDRARLAVTAPPFIGLGLMMLGISYRTHDAVIVTAVCEVLVLGILCYVGRRIRSAVAALAGFTLMPFSTILPAYILVPLAVTLALALMLRLPLRGRTPMRAGETVDVLFGVSMMIAAVGAGYLWLTVRG